LAPVAGAARVLARLYAGKPLVDIGNEPKPPHLAIGYDVDAAVGLLLDDLCDGFLDAARKGFAIERLAAFPGLDHVQQIGRPRQAADMGRQDAFRAPLHVVPPCHPTGV
jgi:hypothetical protein